MDEEKTHDPVGHQHQPDHDEAVLRDAAADVVEEGTQEDSMQDEVLAADEDGTDRLHLYDAASDEAMAHALHMEELMQMEDWELRGFEEPHAPADALIGSAEGSAVHAAPEGVQAVRRFAATPGAGVFGNANNQLAAPAYGADRPFVPQWLQRGAHQRSVPGTSRGAAGPLNLETMRRGLPVSDGEAITIRLGTRTNAQATLRRTGVPAKDAVISARQSVLANASSPAVVLAGTEEDEHDNAWYDSIVRDAQRMEEMEDPGLHGVSFQQQPPRSESPREEPYYLGPINVAAGEEDYGEFSLQNITRRWGVHPSELDPDEPGPSTERPTRVPPLADDEVPKFDCGICMETLPVLDLSHGMQCEHRFCVECIASYIEGRIHAGEVPIPCPGPSCKDDKDDGGALHPEECKKSIDFAAFSSWGDRLTERAVPPNRRAYCPNRECGVMLETAGGTTPAMAFCPACSHQMCATCGLDWSAGDSGQHDCAEGPDAVLVKKLATERRWKQCPKCRMLVERSMGCDVMRCSACPWKCIDCAACEHHTSPSSRGKDGR